MITLFSDTETCPTEGMRRAMAYAEVGDEQKNEDPTVNGLLQRVAELTGKEAALFLPTGTMCNLVAVKTLTTHGDTLYIDHLGHIARAETAGAAIVSGVFIQPVNSDDGIFTPTHLDEAFKQVDIVPKPYAPKSRLVCVEQTHNFSGGTVWSADELRAVYEYAHSKECLVHMDGARIANAAAAKRVDIGAFTRWTDTVWIDFTKGLGAPFGAVLAGSKDFIAKARVYKHAFGGAMRQAGVMAAACLYALDNNLARIGEDNDKATTLYKKLAAVEALEVKTSKSASNMVFFRAKNLNNDLFVERLLRRGVETSVLGSWIRAVTHLDVSIQDVEKAADIVADEAALH